MNILFTLVLLFSFICIPIFLILALIKRLLKRPCKKSLKKALVSAILFIISSVGLTVTSDPAVKIESIELSLSDEQSEYDINTEIPVKVTVLPENADTNSLEYITDSETLIFSESTVNTGSEEGIYQISVESGDVMSNTITISVVDLATREAAQKEEEQRLAEEKAAKEAEEKRLAEEQVAKEAEEKRLAEEKTAKEAEEKRLAEEQAAKEAEEKRLAEEQAAKEAKEKRLAEEQAAKEAEEKRLAEEKTAQTDNTSPESSIEPPASSSTMVWVDDTAKRYHRKDGCGMDNAYQVTLEEAIAMGKTPCGRCY